MSTTHKRYQLDRTQIQDLLNREFKGSAQIDTVFDNGDILINQGGSFRKMKADDISKLTQRYVHIQEDNATSNVSQTRAAIASSELTQEAYDRSIRKGKRGDGLDSNPFIGRSEAGKVGRQNTFGSPNAVLAGNHAGLPSQREYHQTGLPSSAVRGKVNESNLPSDVEHRAGYRS